MWAARASPPPPLFMSEEILATDITGKFGPEFMDGLIRELKWKDQGNKARYWVRQSAIKKRENEIGRQMLPNSFGQKVLSIDYQTWFDWVHTIGWDAMHDAKELYRLARDNDEWKVPGFWKPDRISPTRSKETEPSRASK